MSDVIKTKKKRVMTPEMLENLKKAREKAMEVRNRLKLSEVEQIKHAKAKIQQKSTESALSKRARIKALAEAELIAEKEKVEVKEEVTEEIKEQIKEPEPVVEAPVEEPVDPPKKAKEVKKKEKKIKYVYESETSEEEEIIVVKKKKNKPKQQEEPEQQQYQEPPIIPFVMKQGPISGRRGGRTGFY